MDTSTDKCYSVRKNMTWPEVKRAMTRVKKFRKQGLYLVVEQSEGSIYLESRSKLRPWLHKSTVHQNDTFTVRVMGPRIIKQEFSNVKGLRK